MNLIMSENMVVNGEHEKISIGRVLVSGSTPQLTSDDANLAPTVLALKVGFNAVWSKPEATSRASSNVAVRKYALWKAVRSSTWTLTLVWSESSRGTAHAGRGAALPLAAPCPVAAVLRATGALSRPSAAACCPGAWAPERVRPAEVVAGPAGVLDLLPGALEMRPERVMRGAGAMMGREGSLKKLWVAVIKDGESLGAPMCVCQ